MRTIKLYSGSFRHVTTFGHWIATANSDSTVSVYDSVTGTLRLSLSPGSLVQAIVGSPDGSTLLCASEGSSTGSDPMTGLEYMPGFTTSITGWDIQTGGLAYTFISEAWVEDMVICSKGRYLACRSLGGSVTIWEVAYKSEVATFGSGTRVTHLCWLEPGKQLVVAGWKSAEVWDVVTRRVLWSFTMDDGICGVAYAQRLDRFAIATTSESEPRGTITVVDPHTGTSFIHKISHRTSGLVFSPVTNEFLCRIGTHAIGLFSLPARSWRQFYHPFMITSVSTLSNGTVVVTTRGTRIQLLSLDEGNPPSRQPTTLGPTFDTLDEGKIIVFPSSYHDRDHIALLETSTMSRIQAIPPPTSGNYSKVLCASLKHRIVVTCSGNSLREYLQLWRFGDETPSWVDRESGEGLVGGISPSGSRLVVIDGSSARSRVRVWNIENGTRVADIPDGPFWPGPPLEIRFESEDKFYSHHHTFCIPFTIFGSSIIRHERLLPAEQSQRRYDVDDSHEWIVGSSKKICWIPPGYFRRGANSYCWVGTALIMAGQDGVLRKLTLREPS